MLKRLTLLNARNEEFQMKNKKQYRKASELIADLYYILIKRCVLQFLL